MDRLSKLTEQIAHEPRPPVHLWNPEQIGTIDIYINSHGHWFHEGEQITRDRLIRLFASILWHEKSQHYLVTPAEKLAIDVEDSPYIIHQVEHVVENNRQTWVATTNTHEQVIISVKNPVELRIFQGQLIPYVNVRYDLWARVNRSIYYQWVTVSIDLHEDDQKANTDSPGPEYLVLKSQDYEFKVALIEE